jgi:hypothetical protein
MNIALGCPPGQPDKCPALSGCSARKVNELGLFGVYITNDVFNRRKDVGGLSGRLVREIVDASEEMSEQP